MNEKERLELLKKLEEHLKLKNYSKDTLKVYLIHVKKYLEFLKNENIAKLFSSDKKGRFRKLIIKIMKHEKVERNNLCISKSISTIIE